MKYVYILLIAALGYDVYDYFYSSPFVGKWKSNWELTKANNSHWNRNQQITLAKILGKMTVKASRDTWVSDLNGEIDKSAYKILSSEDDCYQVQFTDSVGEQITDKLCMVDGNIYFHIPRYNLIEVFSPN